MSNIRVLKGGKDGDGDKPQTDPNIVKAAEQLLEMAKKGEIVELYYVALHDSAGLTWGVGMCGNTSAFKLTAALEAIKFDLLRGSEPDE